jgi:hypothetical protein
MGSDLELCCVPNRRCHNIRSLTHGRPPNLGLVVMLEVEAIGDDAARGCPLRHLVAQPQTTKVFERILRSLGHLDGEEGDDLLRKTVPSATGSHSLCRLHGGALWESGREVEGKECKCG